MAKKMEEGEGEGKLTVAKMVRDALEKLGWKAKPDAYRVHIMDTFGKDVPKNQISQYKSAEKRKQGITKKKMKSATTVVSPKAVSAVSGDLDTILEFIGVLRAWESKIGGPGKIRDVVMSVYKKV